MPVQHASLTGADLHEPKGINSAAAETVYVANGLGTGAWSTFIRPRWAYATGDGVASTTSSTYSLVCGTLVNGTSPALWNPTTSRIVNLTAGGLYIVTYGATFTNNTPSVSYIAFTNNSTTSQFYTRYSIAGSAVAIPIAHTQLFYVDTLQDIELQVQPSSSVDISNEFVMVARVA